jgi:hypothetical protein
MSRVGNSDDCGDYYGNFEYLWDSIYRRAREGKRGQALLRELEAALVAMPVKRLIQGAYCELGEVCALGALAVHRKVLSGLSFQAALAAVEEGLPENEVSHSEHEIIDAAEHRLKMTRSLACQIMGENDDDDEKTTPELRYGRVLAWVRENIKN